MASMTANVHAPPTAVACANAGLCSAPAPACAMANTVENSVVPAAPPNWSAVLNTALPSGVNSRWMPLIASVMMFEKPSAYPTPNTK